MVDFGKKNSYDIILGRPFMRQLKMVQDWGYDYIYLRQQDATTRISLKDHSYRDVMKTSVEDFDSATPNESDVPTWLCQKKEIWMCKASDCSDFDEKEAALDRALGDEAYMPEPFREHMFEPNEWTQILATLDVCVNEVIPTKFCDEMAMTLSHIT
ncbi:hypothetical protein L7F22_019986 [Adiantum nelumboides]|nr:hypothetical protein [Adiantum nelumboides]